MKAPYFFLMFACCLLSFDSIAKGNSMFTVKVGNEPEQLGLELWEGDRPDIGPLAIAVDEVDIFVLDKVNSKINVYSFNGEYKRSIYLPKDYKYYDAAVYMDGNPAVLTDSGILVINDTDEKVRKIAELPNSINLPYYFSIDKFGRIGLCGLSSKGRIVIGIIDLDGTFTPLNGFRIFLSRSGYIGIQTSHETFEIKENERLLHKIALKPSMIPFGLTDEMKVYCEEALKPGSRICVINKKGSNHFIEFEYQSLLLCDDTSLIKFFRVNQEGDIVYFEAKKDKFIIHIIK